MFVHSLLITNFHWISLNTNIFHSLVSFEQTNNFDCGVYLLENAENFLIKEFDIHFELEFRLSNARKKRKALQNLIYKLAEAKMIEDAVIKSKS